MSGPAPSIDLPTLLRLLDDDTPEVRRSVARLLEAFEGDVSDGLAECGRPLRPSELKLISHLLLPARRSRLRREWLVPASGLAGLEEDWDHCESLMRAVSDFLHDGVSLRQSLADALDLLAEEVEPVFQEGGGAGLVRHLFNGGILTLDPGEDCLPEHLDLAAVAAGRPSNGVGCGLVTLLVARRLDAGFSAINLPGMFLLVRDQGAAVHDAGLAGREVSRHELLHRLANTPRKERERGARPASPGELVLRLVEDLATTFAALDRNDDAALAEELVISLRIGG